ncbi:unnamed protein product [Adineta steineri]|uniref:Uncharacterized protein n=1 Tax=Adineta steineri TaxID=433720 RepID=A0A820KCP7_9BILA|nr:unnamed protein product [Adineta steineri]CAF4338362.1 unnamed protein product [Adineta steineri]
MTSSNTLLEPIAVIGISCEFAGDIHCANDLWYTLKENAEPANIDPCHRLLILKFVDLLDGAEYSVGKMSGTKTSVHTG